MTEKKVGTCLCDRCDKRIEGNSKDPINATSEGTFHTVCLKQHYQALRIKEAAKEAKKKPTEEVEETEEKTKEKK